MFARESDTVLAWARLMEEMLKAKDWNTCNGGCGKNLTAGDMARLKRWAYRDTKLSPRAE